MQKPLRPRPNLALTPELVALTIRTIEDPGPPPGIQYFEEAEYGPILAETLAGAPGGDVWLFAFGSLIWKPACEVVEERKGLVRGWHRAFRLGWDTRWRGNKEHPNLMMGLCRGGQCTGILYRLPPGEEEKNLDALLRREMRIKPPAGVPVTQAPRWLTVETGGGPVRAVAFVLNRGGPGYRGPRPHEETADVLAKSCGIAGSGAEYLYKTVAKLAQHGIYDRNLWHLQELVAERIRAHHNIALSDQANAASDALAAAADVTRA
jgi:glutathione-specific gamma-glutamylcyclotransferase